jgi:hypothetical protein
VWTPRTRICSVDDLGTPGWDPQFGFGRINADNSVLQAFGGSPSPLDQEAPAVTFETPAPNASVADLVPITVDATDDTGVTEVVLYADGQQVAVDDTAPFEFSWDSTQHADGTATLSAHAFDAAGNEGVGEVSVMVANGSGVGAGDLQVTVSTDNAYELAPGADAGPVLRGTSRQPVSRFRGLFAACARPARGAGRSGYRSSTWQRRSGRATARQARACSTHMKAI